MKTVIASAGILLASTAQSATYESDPDDTRAVLRSPIRSAQETYLLTDEALQDMRSVQHNLHMWADNYLGGLAAICGAMAGPAKPSKPIRTVLKACQVTLESLEGLAKGYHSSNIDFLDSFLQVPQEERSIAFGSPKYNRLARIANDSNVHSPEPYFNTYLGNPALVQPIKVEIPTYSGTDARVTADRFRVLVPASSVADYKAARADIGTKLVAPQREPSVLGGGEICIEVLESVHEEPPKLKEVCETIPTREPQQAAPVERTHERIERVEKEPREPIERVEKDPVEKVEKVHREVILRDDH